MGAASLVRCANYEGLDSKQLDLIRTLRGRVGHRVAGLVTGQGLT